ncbi:MAG: TonB-dependent receptor [Bacteroidales bacterium]|nr:TonB-dependent receptor [Bacteroidales bacterium]
MKLSVLISLLAVLNVTANVYSQNKKLSIQVENIQLRDLFREIENKTEYAFFFNDRYADLENLVTLKTKDEKIESVLALLLENTSLDYKILENNFVVIVPKSNASQGIVVTGRVIDSENNPLPGVNIVEKGTTNGAVTDTDGNYSLTVGSPQSVIVFSFIGYLNEEVEVGSQTTISITLSESLEALEEVVVVGYGTQRRVDVTGSIVSVNSEGIRENASSNLSQALQGRVAGVEMTQTSSRPGSNMQIRIRGTRSLTASNDPLIVLDGIPFAGSLNDINPNDIRSVDILKDASATAIYGSRGANGVILVTTFKGESYALSKPVVNYNGYYGIKNLMNRYPMMEADEFVSWRREAINNGASWTYGADEDSTLNTDWQDLMFEQGKVNSHDLSVAGKTEGGGYSFGAGYYNETTVLPGQDFERYSIRGSFDQKIGNRIKIGISSINSFGTIGGEESNPLGTILSLTPVTNPYNADGSIKTEQMYINNMDTYYNPLMINSLGDKWIDERKTTASYNNIYGELQIIEGLKYHINVGLNYRQGNYGNFRGEKTPYNGDERSYATIENDLIKNWVVENLLYYDKTFAQKHRVNLVAMYSNEQTESSVSRIKAENVTAEYLQYFNFGLLTDDGKIIVDPEEQDYYKRGLTSAMFRANYAFDDKYLLTATIRSDGSSVLADGHKWHTYPALSLGWNATNEEFLKPVTWLSYLKLRLGYGQTSNQAIMPYQTMGKLSTNYYNFGNSNVSGYYVSQSPNLNLGWEYSTTWNYGIDFGLFSNRLMGTFEYYSQKTEDVLVAQSLPRTSGVTESFMTNIGKTENKGVELSLNAAIIKDNNGWSWDLGFNFYANRNKIVALASGQEYDKGNGWFVGHPIDVIYDFNKIGIWQLGEESEVVKYEGSTGEVGMIKVEYTGEYDVNGDPVRQIGTGQTLEDDDRQILGSIEPDFQGGFNTRVGYKGLDLSVIGYFKSGGILVSAIHSPTSYLNMNNGRRGQLEIDYWTLDNPTNAYPKPYGPEVTNHPKYGSTLAYFDASYIKISNITLAYNFKTELLSRAKIDKLRLYVTAQNPLVFASDYYSETGLDPQPNSTSDDIHNQAVAPSNNNGVVKDRVYVVGYNTPATRNFLFGINVTF